MRGVPDTQFGSKVGVGGLIQSIDEALLVRQREGKAVGSFTSREERRRFESALAEYAFRVEQDTGLRLQDVEKPKWMLIPKGQWLEMSRLDKHLTIETERAEWLQHQWKPEFDSLPDGDILDIGCGSGMFLRTMQRNERTGHRWHGIDLEYPNLPTGNTLFDRNLIPNFREYDGKKLPYPDHSFKGITLNYTLSNIPPAHLGEFIGELHRVLAPNGKIMITEMHTYADSPENGETSPNYAPKKLEQLFWPDSTTKQVHDFERYTDIFQEFGFTQETPRYSATYSTAGFPIGETYRTFVKH